MPGVPDPLGAPPPVCSSVVARRSISSTSKELVLEERNGHENPKDAVCGFDDSWGLGTWI